MAAGSSVEQDSGTITETETQTVTASGPAPRMERLGGAASLPADRCSVSPFHRRLRL